MKNRKIYQPTKKLQISDNIYKTSINGLYYITCKKHNDERGFFSEVIKLKELNQAIGFEFKPKQVNLSRSATNVIRGMHAEGWNKLVTVISGISFCALADIKPDSKTFKKVEYIKLSFDQTEQNDSDLYGAALFVSKGIANSICALKGPVNYTYLVDKYYCERDKKDDQSISIFDPDLKIKWPIAEKDMILSKRDKKTVTLRELYPEKF